MNKWGSALVSVVVFVPLAFVALKVLGAVLGLAVKLILLAVAVGVAYLVYRAVQGQIGGPRA